jgi:hypothetical protein
VKRYGLRNHPHCSSIRFARPPRPKISCCLRPAQLCGCNVCGRNAAHLLLSASKVREKRSLAVARSDRWRKRVFPHPRRSITPAGDTNSRSSGTSSKTSGLSGSRVTLSHLL